ncbi:MAG: hypothetical protein ACE5K4_12235 [Candidatus Hydrothermarchaeota archaeon]
MNSIEITDIRKLVPYPNMVQYSVDLRCNKKEMSLFITISPQGIFMAIAPFCEEALKLKSFLEHKLKRKADVKHYDERANDLTLEFYLSGDEDLSELEEMFEKPTSYLII